MSSHSSKVAIYAALGGNGAITATKFTAAFFTGSSAMWSEGIHSLVDTGNQVFLLMGLKRSQEPPTDLHPFGHGKEVYFWAFVVAIFIFSLGAGISFYEGWHRIHNPQPLTDVYINYIVLGLAMVFEGIVWGIAFREFKKTLGDRSFISGIIDSKDPTVAVVLMEDTAAMLGLVIALVGISLGEYLGMPELDGWAALTIGLVLALTATFLAIETKSLLIGEAADPAVVKEVERLAGLEPTIEKVGDVLTMHLGPQDILVNLSVDFKNDVTAGKIETVIAQIDSRLRKTHPEVTRVFIEAENLSRPRR